MFYLVYLLALLIVVWSLPTVIPIYLAFIYLVLRTIVRLALWIVDLFRFRFLRSDRWCYIHFDPVISQAKTTFSINIFTYQAIVLITLLILLLYILIARLWSTLHDIYAAKDPGTEPEQLRQIAEIGAKRCCRAIALNPNTPSDLLLQLGRRFPREVLNNPIFNLMLLEDPNLIETIPKPTLARLLLQSKISVGFIERSAALSDSTPEIATAIALHPKTPDEILHQLSNHSDPQVRKRAIRHLRDRLR
ncbi:hypothetical protein LEP3755_36300 [Leptolyngbya sp. NIES-3755]|nr:hypothetical protein LEP3755_36300 [Leptolyngbya sp. NIES-3755]